MRGGVAGCRLPSMRVQVVPVLPGDPLIFVTGGIEHGFSESVVLSQTPRHIADCILARYAKDTDGALVLAARHTGGRA